MPQYVRSRPPVVDPLDVKWSTVPSNVIHLNEDNFYDWMEDKEHVMIMFYVPWCPHSKASMPEYDQAADEMINKPEYYFGAVECLVTGGEFETHNSLGPSDAYKRQ